MRIYRAWRGLGRLRYNLPGVLRGSMRREVRANGELVRTLREAKGWSQEGLADKALVDVQTVRRVERSERVRRGSLRSVAKALARTIGQLQAADTPAPRGEPPSDLERLRAAVAADSGNANLLTGMTLSRALPLRDHAIERSLALSPARPAEGPRSLLWSSRDDGPGRWLVVGDVGSGKTTLVHALAHDLACDELAEHHPVVVRLAELALEPFRPDLPESLLASKGADAPALVELAAQGGLVLLLDGLDEVLPIKREQVRSLLKVAAAAWPSPIVVTSRPQGLRCPGGFEIATLNPLSDAQVADFLRRLGRTEATSALPEGLLDAPELRRTPLLLTFAALLGEHRPHPTTGGGAAPPRTRHELYTQVLELLLEGLHRTEAAPRMTDLVAAEEALELVAHAFTGEGVVAEPLAAVARRLRDEPPLWQRLERVSRWAAGPEEFLTELADRTAILGQPDGRGTPWRFWHRSLQELLAARRLARQARAQGEAALLDAARGLRRGGERSQWAEPFVLLCGELARPDALLLALAEADPELAVRGLECARRVEPATLRALVAAARPLEDERPRARTFIEGMRNWWSVVGDSARVGLVKAVEYRVGGWIGDDAPGRAGLAELTTALGRAHVDGLEVDAALDALARQLPCFRGPLRGAVYLQAARLLSPAQARALAVELWDAALARGTEVPEDLFFLDELLRRSHGAPDAAGALYDRLAAPPRELVDWRPIPAGEFVMGGRPDEAGFPWEQPRRRVSFPAAWEAGATQVTNGQYAAFAPSHRPPAGVDPAEWATQPAIDVSWYGAVAFCRWLSRAGGGRPVRLPTEAEWEYMARAGAATAYWSGDAVEDLDRVGWFRENSGGRVRAVGLKPANAWGLHDVHGNAWEWVQDWYGPYEEGPAEAPVGPAYGVCRVLRGGCFAWDATWARSAHRSWLPPEARADDVGFRVVR